jgi:hypothetical protein
MDDELFTTNETGRAIWSKLDGEKSLRTLATKFSIPPREIEKDALGLMTEPARRRTVGIR